MEMSPRGSEEQRGVEEELASHLRSLSRMKVKSAAGCVSMPRVCCGALCREKCVFCVCVCLSRERPECGGPQ